MTEPLPQLEARDYVAPLADAYRRIDPLQDGWDSEAFHERAQAQLNALAEAVMEGRPCPELLAPSFRTTPWHFPDAGIVFNQTAGVQVQRLPSGSIIEATLLGNEGFYSAAVAVRSSMTDDLKLKLKLYRVQQEAERVTATVRMEASGISKEHQKHQTTATWVLTWIGADTPLLESVQVTDYEHAIYEGKAKTLFLDRTAAVLGKNPSFSNQLLRSTDYWRARMSRDYGLDVVANHGLALGDVNGDRLDDLYLCMQGGLPNRLFLRNPDGTLTDASDGSGADWLDYCGSALFVDFDNDGDRDLIVGQEWRLLFMENDGKAHFDLAFGLGTHAQTFSLAAADYLFACGYNPSAGEIRQGALGEPMPYHDAQNGGRNMLLRNDGNWEFNDVTTLVGLDEANNRFSFAASWEDYDNDGDLDLYVANDYGRNNLYQNTNGTFRDVAPSLGVEDMSAGMSVSWGDFNRDGWMDIYVSNMFSAAGNRITYQRQFKEGVQEELREQFQRHARGNTLFQNNGKGGFDDVSVEAGITMGRWAWGSGFIDFNNDSFEDIVVANGFISTDDTGDL